MSLHTCHSGWNRIASGIDVEVQHGIPVRIANSDTKHHLNELDISYKVRELTGFTVSMYDWITVDKHEREWSLCIDKNEFKNVLHCLAIASAAMYVDRYHKAIDYTAVDWDDAEFIYDFNHATEHCCIPYGSLNKDEYYSDYINCMHQESLRLIEEGISPMVEAE